MSLPQDVLNLDFAALRTFRLVYQKASFAAAADELGMNASSISYTIERVRKAAGDPLFVRQGGGILPTDQCRSMMESVDRILAEAEHLSVGEDFDPAKTEAEITIFSAAYANQIIFPLVIPRLRREAPGVSVTILSGYGSAREALITGKADMATTVGIIDDSSLHVLKSYLPDEHVCMMDPDHPMAAKPRLSVEDYVSAGHIRFEPSPGWLQAPIRYAKDNGYDPVRVVGTTNALDLADMVKGTDLFAALPSRLAARSRSRLALRPFDFPTPIRNSMYWTPATHRSPVKSWVRGLILEEARQLPDPEI